jgi:hypothetical protein
MGVHSWNPCFIPYERHAYERNQYFFRRPDRAICDAIAFQNAWTPTAKCWVQIAKNVPVVRLDHVPIEDILPGMWQVLAMTTKANN